VLVHAGAGGVGHFAVQLARVHWGAHVTATAGPANQTFLKVGAFVFSLSYLHICLSTCPRSVCVLV
jgi:NADPH:quinone reductase-like Zn-dependent oxidoreductase